MTSTMNPTGGLTELAATPFDENLLRYFSEHVEGERELLDAYVEFRTPARSTSVTSLT